jgi:agmatine deiminase
VIGQRYYHDGMSPTVRRKDERAKLVLQQCFPNREVVMIDSFALNLMGGGVHCWTKDVAAPDCAPTDWQ